MRRAGRIVPVAATVAVAVNTEGRRDMVAAAIRTAFVQEDHAAASTQWRQVADTLRPRFETLARLMDEAEPDVLAFMTFPRDHSSKIHSSNPLERVNKEIKRRTVNGGGIMHHAERSGSPVAAAQKCATHGPLSVATRGGGCTEVAPENRTGRLKVYSTA